VIGNFSIAFAFMMSLIFATIIILELCNKNYREQSFSRVWLLISMLLFLINATHFINKLEGYNLD